MVLTLQFFNFPLQRLCVFFSFVNKIKKGIIFFCQLLVHERKVMKFLIMFVLIDFFLNFTQTIF